MADVEYTVATKFEGEGDLKRAANALERVGEQGRRALADTSSAAQTAKRSWADYAGGLLVAEKALGALAGGAKTLYSALGEGAALDAARGKFDNLAASINTTGDALLGKMRDATQGMMTDAQLVASGTDLMSLGLAKTEDGAVRLAQVIGTLGWDMQQVVLTMANNSTARLDSLGLSMEDVKARAAALKEEGHSLDEAFDLAVLEAGEAKIKLLGNTADTTAGKIQKMTVIVENASDKFKQAFAQGLAEGLAVAVDNADDLADALARVGDAAGSVLGQVGGTATFQFASRAALNEYKEAGGDIDALKKKLKELRSTMGGSFIELGLDPNDAKIAAAEYQIIVDALDDIADAAARANPELRYINWPPPKEAARELQDYTAQLAKFSAASNQGAYRDPLPPSLTEGYWNYATAGARDFNQVLIDQAKYAGQVRDAWEEYTDAITERGGDIFADFVQEANDASEAGKQWAFDLNKAIYDAANDKGAGAGFLSGFAEEIGIASEDIEAALQAAQQQALVTDLAAGVKEAGIAWSEFPGIVADAVAELEGYSERVARAMPSPEDRGYREGYQENLAPTTPPPPIEVPLEIQLREDLIADAIANARGMVEGFTSPQNAYQAVMDMDITAVETGVGRATELINGIPTSKQITINWSQTGTDVLAALRALGVLP